jgi:hypothetical protein
MLAGTAAATAEAAVAAACAVAKSLREPRWPSTWQLAGPVMKSCT